MGLNFWGCVVSGGGVVGELVKIDGKKLTGEKYAAAIISGPLMRSLN